MLANDGLGDCKPEARTVGATADHREKYTVQHVRWDACPVIDHVDLSHQPVANGADGELSHHSCLEYDARIANLFECLTCVTQNIQECLDDLRFVGDYRRQAGVVVPFEIYPACLR